MTLNEEGRRPGRGRACWAVLASLALVACGGEVGPGPQGTAADVPVAERPGGLAVICAQAGPESLNPFLSPDQISADLAPLLFTTLVRYGEGASIEPALATEWEWSGDLTRLTLRLRPDVEWHDGAPVSAADVAWTLRAAADPEYGAWIGPDLAALSGARALDPVTAEIDFSEPFRAGMEPLVGLPILPAHLLADLDPQAFAQSPYHREPVGSGPYRLVARNPDGSIAFERAPAFPAALGQAYLERIVFRPIPEEVTLAAELRTGGVDLCITRAELAGRVRESDGVAIQLLEPPTIQVLALDTRHPILRDRAVRRALSAGLVRSDIAGVISPLARPAGSPLPPSSPWLAQEHGQPDANPALADSLLEAAGWRLPGEGELRRNAAGEPLRLVLAGPPVLELPLTAVQALWRRRGVEAELRFMEWAAYVRTLRDPAERPPVMALAFVPDRILRPDFSGTYHSASPGNLATYRSAVVDSLIARIDAASDTAQLREPYTAVQRELAADVPIIYTVYVPRLAAVGPRLEDVRTGLGGPLQSVAEWWIPPAERR